MPFIEHVKLLSSRCTYNTFKGDVNLCEFYFSFIYRLSLLIALDVIHSSQPGSASDSATHFLCHFVQLLTFSTLPVVEAMAGRGLKYKRKKKKIPLLVASGGGGFWLERRTERW